MPFLPVKWGMQPIVAARLVDFYPWLCYTWGEVMKK